MHEKRERLRRVFRHFGAGRRGYTYRTLFVFVLNGRRAFYGEGHDGFSTKDYEPEGPLHFLLWAGLCLSWLLLLPYTTELFTIGKDEVHVPVKGEHLTDEGASIVDRDFQPPVNEAEHFPTFRFRRRLEKNDQIHQLSETVCTNHGEQERGSLNDEHEVLS